MPPAETVEQTDAAMREAMTTLLHGVQRVLRASRGGVLGAAADGRLARRRWPRPRRSTRRNWPSGPASRRSDRLSDTARADRQRRRRHAARRRREDQPPHPQRRARRGGCGRPVRAGDRPPAAVGAARRRRARLRADGGVRERRGDLRPGHRPDLVGAHAVGRRAGRARRDRRPASFPARGWRSSGWAAARTTPRPRSSSARRVTSTPGSTRTTPRCRSRTCSARPRSSC